VHIRALAAALLCGAVLAGCAGDPDTDGDDAAEAELTPEAGDEATDADDGLDEGDATVDDEALGELEAAEPPSLEELGVTVSDDEIRGHGIVMPLPAGWDFDEAPASQGALFARSGGEDPDQLLFGVAGIEQDPLSGFEGLELDDAVEVIRDSVDQEPERDEEIDLEGAVDAQLLEFVDVPLDGTNEDSQRSYQVVILAEDAEGMLALFNYVALTGAEDTEVTEQLVATAGFDPDTEPFVSSQP
jgi:hypothetical protein